MGKSATLALLCFFILSVEIVSAQDDTPTPEAAEGQAAITRPAPGDVVFGEVQVTGTAEHSAFRRFELDFASADSPDDWLQVQDPVSQQVPSGILGVWDVSSLPDGLYWLRLRVFARDGSWLETIVEDIEVANVQPTAVPTVLPTPTEAPTEPPPTAGPSPTPIIRQPPTNTPRPGGGAAIVGGGEASIGEEEEWLGRSRLQEACCNGIYIVLLAAALIALYMSVRTSFRPWLRRIFRRRR